MNTATKTWTEHNLLHAQDFEPQCEHQFHIGDTRRHGGPTAWLQTGMCPRCGTDLNALVCDPWRKLVSAWAQTAGKKTTCPSCLKSFHPVEGHLTFTRI